MINLNKNLCKIINFKLIEIVNKGKEKYFMKHEAEKIFKIEEGSSTNIINDQNKLAKKLGLDTWFNDYYNASNQVIFVSILLKGIGYKGIR